MEPIEEYRNEINSSSSLVGVGGNQHRICLVGEIANIADIIDAAQTFAVPVITSETGLEIINDVEWRTHFVLDEFEGPIFDNLHKAKQIILGPPALKKSAELKNGLPNNQRPIYNFAMRGVVTCFTGVRKKDELTRLVHLIHSMGGCIRKDMNMKMTHLISTHSFGEKYSYAKTFRLTVVRPGWVYASWDRRNDLEFSATNDVFSKEHALKAFEGQKICFFGFSEDEHQHMVEVLQSNGGIPTDINDPECSHVVMPNSGGICLDEITNNISSSTHTNTNTVTNTNIENINTNFSPIKMDICDEADAVAKNIIYDKENQKNNLDIKANNPYDDDDDDDNVHFDERLVIDYDAEKMERNCASPIPDDLDEENEATNDGNVDLNANASTPKKQENQMPKIECTETKTIERDGIVLSNDKDNDFLNPNNLSPILVTTEILPKQNEITAQQIEDDEFLNEEQNELKRKRDSFDSVSLISFDSFALPTSTKKPKLVRTGSITRSIRRSMSFVAERTPIAKMIRSRRSSVTIDATTPTRNNGGAPVGGNVASNQNADDSFCSLASVETTFNESIRKPVKEKLRNIRTYITRSSSKKEKYTINCPKTPEKDDKIIEPLVEETNSGFKTPKAPGKFGLLSSASKKQANTPKKLSSNKTTTTIVAQQHTTVVDATTNAPSHCSSLTNSISTSMTVDTNNMNTLNISMSTKLTNKCNEDDNISIVTMNTLIGTSTAATIIAQNNTILNARKLGENIMEKKQDEATNNNKKMVVDEHTTQIKPETKSSQTHILKSDWFWYTIQNGYADERDYLFGDYLESIANTPNTDRRDSLPISCNKRKRKRFSQRLLLEGTPLSSGKRRSSVSDAGLLSVSGSFFDCTASPDKLETGKLLSEQEISECEATPAKKSMRFNHFMDFFNTESNYVGILDTINKLFKCPLEELAETNDALLSKLEINSIFSNFQSIHDVHQSMLERLRALQSNWTEDCLIGDIIIQHRDELIKAYPPYVNYFEQMKDALQQCDTNNPRFHAFLKINRTKPECGRQSLQDLMIRPVQRLPSIILLMKDILKYTTKNNADFARLEEALKTIKEVMMYINEDKRRTESRMAIFDIFHDIEGCPHNLVSSNRSLITKCEVNELSYDLSGRGDSLVLYLFSDTIEVCKKRSRGFNAAKSPSNSKPFKHVKLISLNTIRFVIDITDSGRAFALLCRQDKDKLYSFMLADEEKVDKVVFLKMLCKQMAENACRTDPDKAMLSHTSQELDVDISDVNLSTLSKAFKLAARTRLRVGRAFSFNKTPSKLKRAVSTMMNTSPFGSTNSLTPATQLAQMRLASCTNIHEAVNEEGLTVMRSNSPSAQSEICIPVPPLSVQPIRKNKASTLAGIGRL